MRIPMLTSARAAGPARTRRRGRGRGAGRPGRHRPRPLRGRSPGPDRRLPRPRRGRARRRRRCARGPPRGTPGPRSRTVTLASPAASPTSTVTTPPRGEWRTALAIRLSRARRIAARVPQRRRPGGGPAQPHADAGDAPCRRAPARRLGGEAGQVEEAARAGGARACAEPEQVVEGRGEAHRLRVDRPQSGPLAAGARVAAQREALSPDRLERRPQVVDDPGQRSVDRGHERLRLRHRAGGAGSRRPRHW